MKERAVVAEEERYKRMKEINAMRMGTVKDDSGLCLWKQMVKVLLA